jgi:hypothetical protein
LAPQKGWCLVRTTKVTLENKKANPLLQEATKKYFKET